MNFLGRFITKYRWAILISSLILFLLLGGLGSLVIPKMTSGGYFANGSDSIKVNQYLKNVFHDTDPAVVIALDAGKSIDDPLVAQNAAKLEKEITSQPGVVKTLSYWSSGKLSLMASPDHKTTYLFVYGKNADPTLDKSMSENILHKFYGQHYGFQIYVSGLGAFSYEVSKQIADDLRIAESVSVPLTFLLLLIVFGALVASSTPLIIGIFSILGALFVLYLISFSSNVSVFALNLVTGMGLGLGIDYALLIVNRFREELASGINKYQAVNNTVRTAGKTVFFSGVTVIISLASLTLFHLDFLKSFGYAGISVIAMAIIASIFPLPALLAILGDKVDKGLIRKNIKMIKEEGAWSKIAKYVMRRPLPVIMITIAILALISFPATKIKFSQVDARTLPANDKVAFSTQLMADRFPSVAGNPIEIIFPKFTNPNDPKLIDYLSNIKSIPEIVGFGQPQLVNNVLRIQAIENVPPRSGQGQNLIDKISKIKTDLNPLIGGAAASYTDSQESIAHDMPWALLWISLGTALLLFVFTGSIILPIKAVILNYFSLVSMLGAISYVFVSNHLHFLVGKFTNVGSVDTSILVLIIVVAFGLSMDYEVFLLSRIKEEHDLGRDNTFAVIKGVQRSARIITAAAGLLAVVFAAFLTSKVTMIKMMGFGVAVAILVDATIIRALLVPALMRVFGEANWWAPKKLQKFTVKH